MAFLPVATIAGESWECRCAAVTRVTRLDPQDGLYTVATRDGGGDSFRVIGSIGKVLVAPEDPQAVLSCHGRIRKSESFHLTVTEKGYCYSPGIDIAG